MTHVTIPVFDRMTLIRNETGCWVCRIGDRSSGELCFDEMLGHVARMALGISAYPMRTRDEIEANARRHPHNTDDPIEAAEHEQYVLKSIARDFPEIEQPVDQKPTRLVTTAYAKSAFDEWWYDCGVRFGTPRETAKPLWIEGYLSSHGSDPKVKV